MTSPFEVQRRCGQRFFLGCYTDGQSYHFGNQVAEATALTIDIGSLVIGDTVSVTSAGGPIIKAAISVARDTIQAIDAGYCSNSDRWSYHFGYQFQWFGHWTFDTAALAIEPLVLVVCLKTFTCHTKYFIENVLNVTFFTSK